MQLEKLDRIADELAEKISSNTSEAEAKVKANGEVLIPTGEFADIAKARNEQVKQANEELHWKTMLNVAEIEAKSKQAELDLELKKLEQTLEIEKMKAQNEAEIAKLKAQNEAEIAAMRADAEADAATVRAEAEKEAAEINKQASDTRSKRDLIGRILDFVGKVLVAILGLGACIYQASTILREEEDGNYVNTRSTNFWHKPRT